MNISYLLIGGNQGDRKGYLAAARAGIERMAGRILRQSSLYRTAAWGKTDQPDFLNQALEVHTELEAPDLMTTLLHIEEQMGRVRTDKYGARIIDIDMLFYNSAILHSPLLTIPHPQIPNRRFVLAPLEEIAPLLVHPQLGKTIKQLLAECPDPLDVKKISSDFE